MLSFSKLCVEFRSLEPQWAYRNWFSVLNTVCSAACSTLLTPGGLHQNHMYTDRILDSITKSVPPEFSHRSHDLYEQRSHSIVEKSRKSYNFGQFSAGNLHNSIQKF